MLNSSTGSGMYEYKLQDRLGSTQLDELLESETDKRLESDLYRLTQVGILRALTRPGFFLSTRRASTVITPAVEMSRSARIPVFFLLSCMRQTYLHAEMVSIPVHGSAKLSQGPMSEIPLDQSPHHP